HRARPVRRCRADLHRDAVRDSLLTAPHDCEGAESDERGLSMNTTTTATDSKGLLDRVGLAALLKCSTRTVTRLQQAGRLPAPLHLLGLTRWRVSDIERWLAASSGYGLTAARQIFY